MKWLVLIAGLWVLGGCAFAPPSPDATATMSRASTVATIDLAISVANADTDEPIVVDAVWLDDAQPHARPATTTDAGASAHARSVTSPA